MIRTLKIAGVGRSASAHARFATLLPMLTAYPPPARGGFAKLNLSRVEAGHAVRRVEADADKPAEQFVQGLPIR